MAMHPAADYKWVRTDCARRSLFICQKNASKTEIHIAYLLKIISTFLLFGLAVNFAFIAVKFHDSCQSSCSHFQLKIYSFP